MRFMIIRKADKESEAGLMPSEELLAAMGRYNEEMFKAGVFVSGDGLHPSSKGFRVRFSSGKPAIVDGPFEDTQNLVAGYTIIQVGSREEAIEWARRWPALDANGSAQLEVRQVFELDDFAPSPALDQHRELDEQLARKNS